MTVQPWGPAPTPVHPVPATNPAADIDSWTSVLGSVIELARGICTTEFVPKGLQTVEKTTAAVLYSRELGLPPMTGLGSIHVINGRAGISAELMRALVQRAGHQIRITEMSADRCLIKGRRDGEEEWSTASYTMTEAVKAKDVDKNPNYKTRPAEMLLARATTRLCRMVFADVIHGLASTEELEDLDDAGEPPVLTQAPPPVVEAPAKTVARSRRKQHTTPPAAEPPSQATPPARKSISLSSPAPHAEAPAQPEPAETIDPATGEITASGRGPVGIIMHFDRLGVTDRSERIQCLAVMVGHPIQSSKDLTPDETSSVLAALSTMRIKANLDSYVIARMPGKAGEQREQLAVIRNHLRALGCDTPEQMTEWAAEFTDRPGLRGLVELTDAQRAQILTEIQGGKHD